MSEQTMAGITVQRVETSRISTRLLSSGSPDAEPVIFVHGNVSTATFWEEVMLALPEKYRGLAYDQRGYGEADIAKKIDATRGMGDLADDLEALMNKLGIQQAHLIGHSAGGSVLWRFVMDHPEMCKSVTLVNPGSPYGFGGTKGLDGQPNADDFAGTGAGTVNPDFPGLLTAQEMGDAQGTPRWTMNSFYWKPPFKSSREDALVLSMCATHVGAEDYPGDLVPSANWPMVGPGKFGMVNALSPKHLKSVEHLYAVDPKPPILWIRGSDDQIVSDGSFFDIANLGKLGLVPGWPGDDVAPPQPMVSQTRVVLEKYANAGGSFKEVVIAETGHSPYIEKPAEFNAAFHEFIGG